jgi:ubiquinone/menaquinone biosynthesis C-methylase UbiE
MRALDIEIDRWRIRREKLGDAAVGRKGEDAGKQGENIAALLREELPAHAQHGLDFGCGWGRLTPLLASVCGHLWAVDVLESWVARASDSALNVTGLCLTDVVIPVEAGSMDLVVDVMSLQSVQAEAIHLKVCKELKRVAAPGARFMSLSLTADPLRDRRIQLLDVDIIADIKSTTVDEVNDEYSLWVGTKR